MSDAVNSSEALSILLTCGLMGLIGQGARAAVGLKTMTTSASTTPSQQSEFNAAYLLISLMIGFIAGVLAGLAVGLDHFRQIDLNNIKVLIGVAVAGYAGSDFIENALSIIIPTKPPAGNPPGLAGADVQALGQHVNRLANVIAGYQGPGVLPQPAAPPPGAPPAAPLVAAPPVAAPPAADAAAAALTTAFRSCAPQVRADTWVGPLGDAFTKFQLNSNRRKAAAIGQFLVEAGAGFQEVVENLHYRTAARIHQVFPNEFPTVASAEAFVNNPVALGNRAYAHKGGNGDEASGDGFKFRGRGLIQLTGRNEYAQFGATQGMTADQAAQFCETPAGAAMSGCWYLSSRGCLPLADTWSLSKITRLVNGAAMLGNDERIAFSNAFLNALGN